jgi:hypothetical protein
VKAPAPAPQKRQKVVLKPGHTLADWYTLSKKEKNLAGSAASLDPYGGIILRKITTEEVHITLKQIICFLLTDAHRATPSNRRRSFAALLSFSFFFSITLFHTSNRHMHPVQMSSIEFR